MAAWELSEAEGRIIHALRSAMQQAENGKLTVFWQGSAKRRIVDVEPAPRLRVSSVRMSAAVDD